MGVLGCWGDGGDGHDGWEMWGAERIMGLKQERSVAGRHADELPDSRLLFLFTPRPPPG